MANRLYNHKAKIRGIQPAKSSALQPGMLLTFRYKVKDIMDKNPLIVFLVQDGDLIDGLNLNYLTEYKVLQLFKNFGNEVGVSDKDASDNPLLNEHYTLVNLPSYKSGTSNPLAKAESIIKMKRLYKELIKPKMLRTDDIYRSYKINNISNLKVVRYTI